MPKLGAHPKGNIPSTSETCSSTAYRCLAGAFERRTYPSPKRTYLDSQVAGSNRPLYPKVDHYWFKVARNYEPLALQVLLRILEPEVPTIWVLGGLGLDQPMYLQ